MILTSLFHLNVRVRFGGISNFSEVEAFFAGVPAPRVSGAYLTQIEKAQIRQQ